VKRYFVFLALLITPMFIFPAEITSYETVEYAKIVRKHPRHRKVIIKKRRIKKRRKTMWFGLNGGYDISTDVWNAGGQLKFPAGPFCFMPGGSMYFTQNNIDWQANIDLALSPRFTYGLYGGAGFAIAGRDTTGVGIRNIYTGLNLFAGYQLPLKRTPIRPYTEFRCTWLEGKPLLQVNLGVDFAIGKI